MFVVAEAAAAPAALTAAAELTSHGRHPHGQEDLKEQEDDEKRVHCQSVLTLPVGVVVARVSVVPGRHCLTPVKEARGYGHTQGHGGYSSGQYGHYQVSHDP